MSLIQNQKENYIKIMKVTISNPSPWHLNLAH